MDAYRFLRLVPFVQWMSLVTLFNALPSSATVLDEVVVNQVLTAQNSPYYAVTNVRLTDVTMEPGTTILVTGPYEVTVNGVFHAVGTAGAPIIFKQATNGMSWKGLLFANASVDTRFEFCRVEGSDNSGLRIVGTALVLRSCVFANNSAPARGGGINTDSALALEDCAVTNNLVSGSDGRGGGVATLESVLRCVRCIISGNRVVTSSGSRCVSYGGGVYGEARIELLDGCQITGNSAAAYGGDFVGECTGQGGGVWSSSEVFGTNVLISGNEALADGANHTPASYGGGVWCKRGDGRAGAVLLINSEVSNNSAVNSRTGHSRGGGIFCLSISAYSTVFVGNSTTAHPDYHSDGGAIYDSGVLTLGNCLLAQNRNSGTAPVKYGSAIYAGDPGSLIDNCTIVGNLHNNNGSSGALFDYQGAIRNSIIYGNDAAFSGRTPAEVTYSLIQDGFSGTGNIDADPLFADNTNYFLTEPSPAVDAGNPDPALNDAGPHALGTSRNDMGVYGGPGALPALGYVAPLLITSQPVNEIVNVGSTVLFNVGVMGGKGPIQYQWRFNGVPVVGETNSTLTLTNVALSQAGIYSVTVANLGGNLVSADATLSVTQLKMYAGLTISGIVGANYRVDFTTNFNVSGWTILTNINLPSSPYLFFDVDSGDSSSRAYRFVLLP